MKKISILFYLVLSFFAYLSCEQQDEINSVNSTDLQISIDKNSQINLEPTTVTKEQIENISCGEIFTTTLLAGQHINVGTLTISNDKENLYVTYTVSGNWWLSETHLYVGSKDNLPLNGGGNPKIGHFPYHGDHELVKTYPFTIPLDQLDECFVISAHAVVIKKENGEVTASETAFGEGKEENVFPGNRWGWYIDYCQEVCTDDNDDDNDDDDDDDDDGGNDDNSDDNNGGNDESEACLDAFAYNELNSTCFTYTNSDSNTIAGWSNTFNYDGQVDQHYILPLFAKVDNCGTAPNIDSNIYIGDVEIYLFSNGVGDGMQLFSTVKYVIKNDNYELSDVYLYLDDYINPSNYDPSKGDYNYDNVSNYWNSSTTSFENMPWPQGDYNRSDTYIIPDALVCKVNTSK